jgi:hypothetical protein
VPKEKFAALADYTTNPLFSDLERLVIRYAEEMTEKVQVDSRLVEDLKQQLGPQALVQLTLSIAAANFTNRFNEALGTELETWSRGDPHVQVERESGTHHRWLEGHWRSDRETSGRRWSERGHHVREGGQRGFRRGQSD